MKTKNYRRATDTYFIAGDFNVYDDLTSFKLKASDTFERWDKAIMPAKHAEERHPQDFLRGRKEIIGTPFARPELADKFVAHAGLILNGAFNEDSVWTKSTGWTIEAPVNAGFDTLPRRAASDGTQSSTSSLSQTATVTSGITYRVTFQIIAYTAGTVTPVLGNSGTARSGLGTFSESIVASSTTFSLDANSDFIGSIGYVRVE